MAFRRWVLDQFDTLAKALRLLYKRVLLEQQLDQKLRQFEKDRESVMNGALRSVANAYAAREGLPADSVKVVLDSNGSLIAEMPDGKRRILGYIDEARPN